LRARETVAIVTTTQASANQLFMLSEEGTEEEGRKSRRQNGGFM
jgi:hypothetical protein